MRNPVVFLLFVLMIPTIAFGAVSISITSPSGASTFNEGSHISATGNSSFGSSDKSVDLIEIYVVADNPNPSYGVITESNLANIYYQENYLLGGGLRNFNTVGVDFNAVRKNNENSSTYYYVSVRPMNAAVGFFETTPGSGIYLYTSAQIFIN